MQQSPSQPNKVYPVGDDWRWFPRALRIAACVAWVVALGAGAKLGWDLWHRDEAQLEADEQASAAKTAAGADESDDKWTLDTPVVGRTEASKTDEGGPGKSEAAAQPTKADAGESGAAPQPTNTDAPQAAPAQPAAGPTPEPAAPSESAAERAVKALLAAMKRDDNPFCYVFPPIQHRKVQGYEDFEQRYTKKQVSVPVYDDQYETVTVTRPVKEGSRTLMKTFQERRIVRRKQTGTREEEQLVLDPKGDVVRTEKRPILGPGGPDQQPAGWLGNNAMALAVLLRCGVTPQQEPSLEKLAERLSLHVYAFGIPDSTWDLAWTLVAFVEYPDGRYRHHLERLYGRLLSGQIAEGPGKGLWGPVCVSPALLRRAVEEVHQNQPALNQPGMNQPGNAPVMPVMPMPRVPGRRWPGPVMPFQPNVGPNVVPDAAKIKGEVEAAQERVFHAFAAVSMHGPRFAEATQPAVLKDEHNSFGNDVYVPGWPVNLYREITADLESTALAAYALRVVAAHHTLPASIEFPRGVSFAGRFSTRDALANALATISAAQREDGSWDEMVRWQLVKEFRNGNEGQFGPEIKAPDPVPSQAPAIATAQACDAMEDLLAALERVREPTKMKTKPKAKVKPKTKEPAAKPVKLADPAVYREQIVKGRTRLLQEITEVARDQASGLVPDINRPARANKQAIGRRRHEFPWLVVEPLWGGLLEPYSLVCQVRLEGMTESTAQSRKADRLPAMGFVASAVGLQAPSGLWPVEGTRLPWTPSLRERGLLLAAALPGEKAGDAGGDRTDARIYELLVQRLYHSSWWRYNPGDAERLATAHMLLYLSGETAAGSGAAEASPVAGESPSPSGKDGPEPTAGPRDTDDDADPPPQ